jgi:hypothetical protein
VHLDEGKLFVQLGDKEHADCSRWILDSGATNHMTGERSAFTEIDNKVHGTVHFGDGVVANIEGRGTILIRCKTGEHEVLPGVYLIPRLTANILSLGQLEEDGHKIMLHAEFLRIWDRRGCMVAKIRRGVNRLYVLHLDINKPVCMAAQGEDPAWRWHARYGHLNFRSLRKLEQEEMVHGLQICDSCLAGKQRRLSFPGEAKYRATFKLELVHGDLCGPITSVTPTGKKYFFLLVDDVSRYMWLTLLGTKDEAMNAFMAFQSRAEAEAGRKLGTLRTDRGDEFTARNFLDHCSKHSVQRHLTAPYTPEQNGVVERRNQSVMAWREV